MGAVGKGAPPSGKPIISTVVLYAIHVSIDHRDSKAESAKMFGEPCRARGEPAWECQALSPRSRQVPSDMMESGPSSACGCVRKDRRLWRAEARRNKPRQEPVIQKQEAK